MLGSRLERWQSIPATVLLTCLAYVAYLAAILAAEAAWGLSAVGLSGLIWAWVIPTWRSARSEADRDQLRPIMWLTLVWIPLAFAGAVAFSTEQRLAGAVLANLFHAVGLSVGGLYALAVTAIGRRT